MSLLDSEHVRLATSLSDGFGVKKKKKRKKNKGGAEGGGEGIEVKYDFQSRFRAVVTGDTFPPQEVQLLFSPSQFLQLVPV